MKVLRYLVPVLIFAGLVAFFAIGLKRDPRYIPSPLIGKPAPAFELSTVEDPARKVSSRDFRGRMYVVNVWGTWCAGCREEHATLLEIARSNVVPIVGLNWKDELPLAQQWLQQLGNPYVTTGFDPEGRVGIDWGVYGAPETFLVDGNGVVQYKHIAPLTMEVWQREFLPRIRSGQSQ
jgi:cytochrome c biogenesis protein CcmG, thiol:disulfide interchange protein DsbE